MRKFLNCLAHLLHILISFKQLLATFVSLCMWGKILVWGTPCCLPKAAGLLSAQSEPACEVLQGSLRSQPSWEEDSTDHNAGNTQKDITGNLASLWNARNPTEWATHQQGLPSLGKPPGVLFLLSKAFSHMKTVWSHIPVVTKRTFLWGLGSTAW